MEQIQQKEVLKEQYKDSNTLATRISIHDKYSVNKQGFIPWIASQYELETGNQILELGCGNGAMWKQFSAMLPHWSRLILSDFSEGMLTDCKRNLGLAKSKDQQTENNHPESATISFQCIDITSIPYADGTFDRVIANMMLYHVPDLDRALQEVKRVLKPGGSFYCATYGENGIIEYVESLFKEVQMDRPVNRVFTLQNGGAILSKHFPSVTRRDYIDHLEVTETADLVDYVYSLTGMSRMGEVPRERMTEVLEAQKQAGIIHVPKEYGLFVATKEL